MPDIDSRQEPNVVNESTDSFRDKCMRELELGGSAVQGIGDEFVDAIKHPTKKLPELATGLAFGTVMGALTHGGFGIKGALATAASAMFVKQMIGDGGNVLAAAGDAWKSPSDFQRDKEIVAKTVGGFAVDTAAFGIGAVGGSRFAAKMWRPSLSPTSFESFETNISYETAGSKPRIFDVPSEQTGALHADLQRLLSVDDIGTVKGLKTSLDTTYGTARLRSYFSDSQNTLRIDFEGTRSSTTPRLEVVFTPETHLPSTIQVHDDPARLVPAILDHAGYKPLAAHTASSGEIGLGDFVLAEKFGKADAAGANAAVRELHAKQGPEIELTGVAPDVPGKPPEMVPQKGLRVASIEQPLATTDITTCSALVVIDEAAGKHLLAHADALTNPDLLRKALSGFDLAHSKIYIMEGEYNLFNPQLNLLGSAERIVTALGNDPNVMKNVRFVRYRGPSSSANIVSQNGKLYAEASSWVQSG